MIRFVDETGSTNADLAARVAAGDLVAEGEWLVAGRQTEGRGRQGRTWFDGAGNFMGSTVVRRRPGDPPAPSLALLAGLALHDAVAAFLPDGAGAALKWPNDLMIGQAKLAGILLEAVDACVIVGVGVNLAAAPQLADRETIALVTLAPPPSPERFATALADSFAADLQRWRDHGLAPIVRRWLAVAHPLGTRLHADEPGLPARDGEFAGLTDDGALRLRLADGSLHVIHAGEVRLAGAR